MVLWMEWNYTLPESRSGENKSAMIQVMPLMKRNYAPPEGQSGRNMSISMIVQLMEYKYALPDDQKWREQVSLDGATNEMKLRTAWESKVPMERTCQPWLCCLWNGNTHPLRSESGRNMSAMIVLLMKWEYALPDNWKWREQVSLDNECPEWNGITHPLSRKRREHVSHDCATHEI